MKAVLVIVSGLAVHYFAAAQRPIVGEALNHTVGQDVGVTRRIVLAQVTGFDPTDFRVQLDRMIQDYTDVISRDAGNAAAHQERGMAYKAKRDCGRAIADFDRAIALDPKLAFAYNGRGLCHRDLGDLDRAVTDFTTAIEYDPKLAAAYFNRGNIYKTQGLLEQATLDFATAGKINPRYTASPAP